MAQTERIYDNRYKYNLKAEGCSFDRLVRRVARQMELEPKDVVAPGKYAHVKVPPCRIVMRRFQLFDQSSPSTFRKDDGKLDIIDDKS